MENTELINLVELAGGALQEKAQQAIADVVANMQDPNTPWKNKREVNIKLAFTQNEDRSNATCDISVTKKEAPVKPVQTQFSIGKDLRDGSVYMEEYGPQIKGQMTLDDLKQEVAIGDDLVDAGTGELTGKVTRFVKEA